MSPRSRVREKSSHSDPPATPIRPASERTSFGSRSHSLSPRKRDQKQPLHIRLNLTETQMDKITEAFAYKVNSSPKRERDGADGTHSKLSHRRNKSSLTRPQTTLSYESTNDQSVGDSTMFSELMSTPQHVAWHSSLAERRHRETPTPIQVSSNKPAASLPRWPNMQSVAEAVSPLESSTDGGSGAVDDPRPSSYHSHDGNGDFQTGTMNSHAAGHFSTPDRANDSGRDMYNSWARLGGPFISPGPGPHPQVIPNRLHRTQSIAHGINRHSMAVELISQSTQPISSPRVSQREKESPLFSPLPLYFRGQDFPTVKKGEKTMIGQNGWLERTDNVSTKEKRSPQKKGGIINSIKRIAKDMTELHYSNRRFQPSSKESLGTSMAVSLDSREQSLLYCELEFHLTNALNDYIISELDHGHLDPDKLKKVADSWYQLGRPRVVGFRYDLETQLELVSLHIDDFVFHGRRQGNPVEIAGLLHAMKTNARAMRIRTFCQPDSVIAKQLVDAQSLFNLINAGGSQQIALAEIAQFFKVIVERELGSRKQRVHGVQQPEAGRGRSEAIHERRG